MQPKDNPPHATTQEAQIREKLVEQITCNSMGSGRSRSLTVFPFVFNAWAGLAAFSTGAMSTEFEEEDDERNAEEFEDEAEEDITLLGQKQRNKLDDSDQRNIE